MVEKLTNPPPAIPREVVFRPASPPLPDIGFPDEIPGLTVNQATVDQYIDWQSFERLGLMVGMTPMMRWTLME